MIMPKRDSDARPRGILGDGLVIPSVLGAVARLSNAARLAFRPRDGRLLLWLPKARSQQSAEVPLVNTAAPKKGDLLVWSGGRWVRLSPGTDAHVLTLDSTQTEGVKWAAASGGGGSDTTLRDVTRDKRVMRWFSRVAGSQILGPNGYNIQAVGTTTTTFSSDGGFYYKRASLTSAGQSGRFHRNSGASDREAQPQGDPGLTLRLRTEADMSNALYWIGLASAQPTNAATGGTVQFFCFRYLQGTDSTWMACTNDGSSFNAQAMSTTPAVDTVYSFDIDYDSSSGEATFTINNTDTVTVSTAIPAAATRLGIEVTAYNNTSRATTPGTGAGIGFGGCYLEVK
jgi:hypothetical protein